MPDRHPPAPVPLDPLLSGTSPGDAPGPSRDDRAPDLRRRNARLHAEIIADRARYLPVGQRALVAAVYEEGRSIAQLAALCGKPPRTLRREVRRIVRRLGAPEFVFVAAHIDRWPGTMSRVARCCILEGMPVRRAAQALRLSLYTVRKHREMVRVLASASLDASKPRSRAG